MGIIAGRGFGAGDRDLCAGLLESMRNGTADPIAATSD